MLPHLLVILLPLPSLLALSLLVLYHLLPLLSLLRTTAPSLQRLASVIPHPRRPRNLPREFFNLPPRLDDASSTPTPTVSAILGIRGKVTLLLSAHGLVSLACGWAWCDAPGNGALLGLSITPIPAGVFTLAFFSAMYAPAHQGNQNFSRLDTMLKVALGRGGITHSTIPRIAVYSTLLTGLITVLASVIPSHTRIILAVTSSFFAGSILAFSGAVMYRRQKQVRRGRIRLLSPSPEVEKRFVPTPTDEELEAIRDTDSWIESPFQTRSVISAFSYSPSITSPRSPDQTQVTDSPHDSSWLTEPTQTPASVPSWNFSPSIHSPEPAMTRTHSRSASPNPENSLPQPKSAPAVQNSPNSGVTDRSVFTPTTALTSTPGSAIRSAGGSIIAAYSPDPFHPLPRGFTSLASYPLSPDQLTSQISLGAPTTRSGETALTFVPSERVPQSRAGSSTWTLETYHSAQEEFKTPAKQIRRAPPPPPMPVDMPLPPTPTFGRSESLFDWPVGGEGKESMEMLMGEREWVEVQGGVEGIQSWGKGGTGVGVVGVAGVLICYALGMPLLIKGVTDVTLALYLISLLIPSPCLILASYFLRYRPPPATRAKKSSTKSAQSSSTHRSLALISESQLSLPISISPKLTPPAPKRESTVALNERLSKLIEPKPSISNFGYDRKGHGDRRHTVYGNPTERDAGEMEAMRRILARRSGDVWIESGHAVEGGGLWSRATEMLKPVPALRVLDDRPRAAGVLTRLQGRVVSLLPKWHSQVDEEHALGQFDDAPQAIVEEEVNPPNESPIRINIESPSKYERRVSAAVIEGESVGEVQVARKGRMSPSPTFFCGQPGSASGYQLDWLTAAVLPKLVPSLKIGSQALLQEGSETPRSKTSTKHFRCSSAEDTPRSHARSSSIDFSSAGCSTPAASIHNRRHPSLRHKSSFSLPAISNTDFGDVRRSFDECGRDDVNEGVEGGVDLPPFPIDFSRPKDLSPVTERDESSLSFSLGEMAALARRAEATLGPSPGGAEGRQRLMSDASSNGVGEVGTASFVSEDEAMAREMELVLCMDTPTRAEFVISPPPSDWTPKSTRTSVVASDRTSSRLSYADPTTPLRPQVSADTLRSKSSSGTLNSSEYSYTDATTDYTTDAEGHEDSPAPPVPELPINFRYPTHTYAPPLMSHPHPPPMAASQNMHRPVQPHPSLNSLLPRKSMETISSQSSAEEVTSPIKAVWKPSRRELELVRALRERAAEGKGKQNAEKDATSNTGSGTEEKSVKGLRPLQLVADRKSNRLSASSTGGEEKQNERLSIPHDLPGVVNAVSKRSSTRMSFGSDKENVRRAKVSKASTGSGIVSGLRL